MKKTLLYLGALILFSFIILETGARVLKVNQGSFDQKFPAGLTGYGKRNNG